MLFKSFRYAAVWKPKLYNSAKLIISIEVPTFDEELWKNVNLQLLDIRQNHPKLKIFVIHLPIK